MNFLLLADSALFLYIFLPIAFFTLCWVVEGTDNVGIATISLGVLLLALQMFTDIHPFSYIVTEPVRSLIIVALYILVGVGYVWIKWYSFVNSVAREVVHNLGASKKPYTSDEIVNAARSAGYFYYPLQVSKYKIKIMGWMIYWPISATWTVLNDPVRRLFEVVYNGLAKSLQTISNKSFDNIINKS